MKKLLALIISGFFVAVTFGQSGDLPPQTKIMTLGVFHFAYPNLDVVKTEEKVKNQLQILPRACSGISSGSCSRPAGNRSQH
jgi:hypothetical protein